MSRAPRNKGFTLVEIMFGCIIVVILLSMTAVSMRPAIDQEGPLGLAYALAGDLRAARAEAMRSGRTVAFCFASSGRTNSLTRSAYLRVGDQKGKIWRTLSYDSEYDATIFLGKWGAAVSESFPLTDGWKTSTSRETALYFSPDGRAFSEDIPALDGRYPLVVASAMAGTFSGPEGQLSAALNAQTVWVSQRGTILVQRNQGPLGPLAPGGSKDLTVAALSDDSPNTGSAPTIVSSTFLPEQIGGLTTAGIGQNFVQIHPNQRDGQQLEYGMATIEVRAEDVDGGPLRYNLSATASSGDAGKFSVSEQEGELSFVYDEAAHRYLWKTVVSWRPPPSAPADLTYNLFLVVSDPEGNNTEVSTAAGLLPQVTSLPPARIVVCTAANKMYLTNLDGANEVMITRNGDEYSPFFSQDGSCVFSFHDLDSAGHRELRSRPANGSVTYTPLADFTGATSNIVYDPTYTFVAITNPGGTWDFEYGQVTSSTSSSDSDGDGEDDTSSTSYSFGEGVFPLPVHNVYILNLMSTDPPIKVTDKGTGEFFWAANARHTFYFGEEVPTPMVTEHGYGPFHAHPGHQPIGLSKFLVGFPPTIVDSEVEAVSAAGRVYNPANRDWYLSIDGSTLTAHRVSDGASKAVYTSGGGFENSATGRANPSWSADGERVAFIANPGPSARIVSMHVLDSSLAPLSSPAKDFELAASNATRAQLSPGGEWIYFLRNRKVMRALNQTGSEQVDITDHLETDITDYVISP